MRAVNPPTQMMLQYLEHCRENNDGVFNDPSTHPYFLALAVAKDVGMDTTTEEYKEKTLISMARWSDLMTNQIAAVSIKEIADCGKFAQDSKNKAGEKMASDLLDSMALISAVFKSWQAAIDHKHIAEWVWADGEKLLESGLAPDIAAHVVEIETKNLKSILSLLKTLTSGGPLPAEFLEKLPQMLQQAKEADEKASTAKAPACDDEKDKKPTPKTTSDSKPPVTPADIMKMLFENAKKPSSN